MDDSTTVLVQSKDNPGLTVESEDRLNEAALRYLRKRHGGAWRVVTQDEMDGSALH